MGEWLITAREQGPAPLLRAWSDLDIVTGRRIEVREGAAVFDGRARGVDPGGHLEVVDARGVVHRVVAGDIRLLD
jgi:biotin-(acetyl-CoA carboxylase) ligase